MMFNEPFSIDPDESMFNLLSERVEAVSGSTKHYITLQYFGDDVDSHVAILKALRDAHINEDGSVEFSETFENTVTSPFLETNLAYTTGYEGQAGALSSFYAGNLVQFSQAAAGAGYTKPNLVRFFMKKGATDRLAFYFVMWGTSTSKTDTNRWAFYINCAHGHSGYDYDILVNGNKVAKFSSTGWTKIEVKYIDWTAQTFEVYVDGEYINKYSFFKTHAYSVGNGAWTTTLGGQNTLGLIDSLDISWPAVVAGIGIPRARYMGRFNNQYWHEITFEAWD